MKNNHDIGNNLTQSNTILKRMFRRMTTNKLILAGIIILMISLICLLIYIKVS